MYLFSFTLFSRRHLWPAQSPTKTFRIFNILKLLNIKIIIKPEGFSGTWAGLTILRKYLRQQYMQLFHSLKNTFAYTKTFFQAVLYNAEFLVEANTLCGQNAPLFFSEEKCSDLLWTKKRISSYPKILCKTNKTNTIRSLWSPKAAKTCWKSEKCYFADFEQVLPGWAV